MNTEPVSLPCSIECEKALLCSLVTNPYEVDDIIRSRLTAESFYVPAHRIIYEAISGMLSARHPIDFVTLKEHLKAEGQLEEVGEVQGLNEIWSFVPTWSNAEHYANIVREKELLRKSILTAMKVIDEARTPGAEFADLRDDIERILTELSMQQRKVGERSLKDITMDWLEELETRSETLKATGLFFGISSLDVALGAIQPGDYVVVTAETSGGKSLLAFQGSLSAADRGLCTAAFTFEMTLRQLWDRMFSHRAQVSMNVFKKGLFSDEERKRLHGEVKRFIDLPLHVSDTRDNDIASIASKLRRLKAKHDPGPSSFCGAAPV